MGNSRRLGLERPLRLRPVIMPLFVFNQFGDLRGSARSSIRHTRELLEFQTQPPRAVAGECSRSSS